MYQFDALGTRWWCEIIGSATFPTDLQSIINHEVNRFVSAYSRFDSTSMLSQLNATGRIDNPSTEFLDMMQFAKDMYDASDGMFNISVGGALVELGYGKRPAQHASRRTMHDFWDHVVLSQSRIEIPADTSIDFGGFGKGWLIDAFGEIFRREGWSQFVINGGGDILVASDEPIKIALENPAGDGTAAGYVTITNGALAVSSTLKRVWYVGDGSKKHHIIDPRTNDSSHGNLVAYVRANTALIADTVATVAIIDAACGRRMAERLGCEVEV